MELVEEGMGESSSPPRWHGGQDPSYDIKNDIYMRLVQSENSEAIANPNLRDLLDAHFSRLPARYRCFLLSFSFSFSLTSKGLDSLFNFFF